MSSHQPFRRGLIACVLLGVALSSAALTLGRSRGVALVGRALDVSIPITLDSSGQAGELCPEADVFHGDSRVDAARVSARVEAASGQNAVVRIRSSLAVDEPVVTVYLRLGCRQKVTRRYVLLAEEPGEIAPPVSAVVPVPAPVPAPGAAAMPGAASRPRRATEAPMVPGGAALGKLESALPAAPPRAQQGSRAAVRAPVTRSGRPRLTVDMLDPAPEREPQLRASAGLSAAPSTDEQVRMQAAALWRSINAQPQDVLRDLQRVQTLENDVKGLRTLVAGNHRTLGELREQLNQAAGQERSLTLAAIALMALLLAAIVVTWWLRRAERSGGGNWWSRRDAAADAGAGGLAPSGPVPPGTPPARAAAMDLRVDESMFESLKRTPRPPAPLATAAPTGVPAVAGRATVPASTFQSSFQPSYMASMRMAKAEELLDIQQQADFFMSLGQADQAIEVLVNHIQHNAGTSALVWLDLLAIYRALKRREDYELLRADFQRVFNAPVPAYDITPAVSGGLEDYPRALTRIAALWPSPKVMDVIEESIFRRPGMDGGEPFDLEAYRELLLLYNLGREVVRTDAAAAHEDSVSESPKSSFFETSMQPLSVTRQGISTVALQDTPDSLPDSGPGQTGLGEMVDLDSMTDSDIEQRPQPRATSSEFPDPRVPRPSPRLGLDIDLTAPAEPARRPPQDDHSIDFELFEPARDSDPGQPSKPR